MGQVIGCVQNKFHGREWRERQLQKITDKVFERFKDESGRVTLTFEDLYIAVLLVYNDINKLLPGRHIDPPSKGQIKTMMEEYDLNLDGELDHAEFNGFMQKLAADTLTIVSQNLIISLVAAPAIALLTKRATEGVPGVGKVVQRMPNSLYATLVTIAVMFLQNAGDDIEYE